MSKRSNLEKYYLSITPIRELHNKGIIDKDEYLKAESFIAEKYCIKTDNLYRLNHLTFEAN